MPTHAVIGALEVGLGRELSGIILFNFGSLFVVVIPSAEKRWHLRAIPKRFTVLCVNRAFIVYYTRVSHAEREPYVRVCR